MHKKQIRIVDLPDGYFKEQLTQLVKEPELTTVWVVAKEGNNRDWAAYIGFPHLEQLKEKFQGSSNYEYYCTRVHFSEDVASRGDKISEAEARAIFPEMEGIRYRG